MVRCFDLTVVPLGHLAPYFCVPKKKGKMTKKRVFILGSGFSRQLSGGKFPTSQKLISQLKKDMSHPVLLRNIQDIPQGDEIQKILSRLALDNHIADEEKKEIMQNVSVSFQKQLSVWKLHKHKDEDGTALESAKELVKELFKPGDVIISMNWDVLLEHIVDLNVATEGSKLYFDYGINSTTTNSRYLASGSELILLKPHGSFNFFQMHIPFADRNDPTFHYLQADSSQEGSFLQNSPLLVAVAKHDNFFDSTQKQQVFQEFRPQWSSDKTCKAEIVLPTHVKPFSNLTFLRLWQQTKCAIEVAKEIIFIGYSLPIEDVMMVYSLQNIRDKIIRFLGKKEAAEKIGTQLFLSLNAIKPYLTDNGYDGAYKNLIRDLNSQDVSA